MSSERGSKRTPTAIVATARSQIARITRRTATLDAADYEKNELVRYACERASIALGEALRDLSTRVDLDTLVPGGPWAYPVGFRSFLAHDYDDRAVSPVVWQTIKSDLPELDAALAAIDSILNGRTNPS